VTPFQIYEVLQILLGYFMWTLIGQGLLFLFVGQHGDRNFVYRLFRQINFPVAWLVRRITPRFIVDRHIGFVALALVIALRLGVYVAFFMAGAIPSITPAGS
jgi:uncharacterized protein YggT (Ycf19 family)